MLASICSGNYQMFNLGRNIPACSTHKITTQCNTESIHAFMKPYTGTVPSPSIVDFQRRQLAVRNSQLQMQIDAAIRLLQMEYNSIMIQCIVTQTVQAPQAPPVSESNAVLPPTGISPLTSYMQHNAASAETVESAQSRKRRLDDDDNDSAKEVVGTTNSNGNVALNREAS